MQIKLKHNLIIAVIILCVLFIALFILADQHPIACGLIGGKFKTCSPKPCIPSETVICISNATPPCQNRCIAPWYPASNYGNY